MQFAQFSLLLAHLRLQFGDRIRQEAFLGSSNWLPRVWRKLSVLNDELMNTGLDKLPSHVQVKIIRIILKDVKDSERATCLAYCDVNDTQMAALVKHFEETGDVNHDFFCKLKGLVPSLVSSSIHRDVKKNIANLVLATPCENNPQFNVLLGDAKNVYLSQDENKIAHFHKLIQSRYWYQDPLFDEADILYVALAACRKGFINDKQYASISRWFEIKKHYGKSNVEFITLFDDKGQVTKEAQAHFLSVAVGQVISFPSPTGERILLTKKQENLFLQQMSQLPTSEQVVMKLPFDFYQNGYSADILLQTKDNLLTFSGKDYYILLSVGVFEAYLKTIFPTNAFEVAPRLGDVSINEIEQSMRQFKRTMSVFYSHPAGIQSDNPRFFHTFSRKAVFWIGFHDMFHAFFASFIPHAMHPLTFQSVDTIRQYLGIRWSHGLWLMVDYLFTDVLDDKNSSLSDMFIKFLNTIYHRASLKQKMSLEVAVLLLDIVLLNPEKWRNQGLNLDASMVQQLCHHIPSPCVSMITTQYFKKEDPVLFSLFKLAMIAEMSHHNILVVRDVETILEAINNQKNKIVPMLSVCTLKISNETNDKRICLRCGDITFDESPYVLQSMCQLLSVPVPQKEAYLNYLL